MVGWERWRLGDDFFGVAFGTFPDVGLVALAEIHCVTDDGLQSVGDGLAEDGLGCGNLLGGHSAFLFGLLVFTPSGLGFFELLEATRDNVERLESFGGWDVEVFDGGHFVFWL